jgi:hypothetical protein
VVCVGGRLLGLGPIQVCWDVFYPAGRFFPKTQPAAPLDDSNTTRDLQESISGRKPMTRKFLVTNLKTVQNLALRLPNIVLELEA